MKITNYKNKISPQYSVTKYGRILEPNLNDVEEEAGVFNPASLEIEGKLYIYYRSVQKPNYSRIKFATGEFTQSEFSVEKSDKTILQPQTDFEKCDGDLKGGVEDPRTVTIDGTHYMIYVGRGTSNNICPTSRVAIASSSDGLKWTRLGRLIFEPFQQPEISDIDPNLLDNKDVILFPAKFGNTYVSLQRFTFPSDVMDKNNLKTGMWWAFSKDLINWYNLTPFYFGKNDWENLKVGAGTPPVLTKYGWMMLYHGLSGKSDHDPNRTYKAGLMFLSKTDPTKVLYISKKSIMEPQGNDEKFGQVNNVVFPSAIFKLPSGFLYSHQSDSTGENFGILYGMSDSKTGLATIHLN